MAKKLSSPAKALYIIFAFALVFSLVPTLAVITAAPVQAQDEETLQVLRFTLEGGGDGNGTAVWSTAQSYNGSSSVELSLASGSTDYAEVAFELPGNVTLAQIVLATTSFWCKSTFGAHIPYFTFELTPFGVWNNSFRINNDAASSTGYGNWAQFVASSTTPEWQWFTVDGDGNISDSGWDTWANLVAQYGTATVTGVYVGISGLDATAYTAYVDDITVNGTTYYGQIQDAIDSATGTIINVAAGTYDEDVTVDLDLTLTGAQAGVDARGRTGVPESHIVGVVEVTSEATNVVFDGFKFTSPTRAFTPRGFNMRVESASSTIRNNIFVADENAGHTYSGYLDFEAITDTLVEQNSFSGDLDPVQEPNVIRLGIASGGSTVTVQNNEMHDVGGGGGVGIMCDNEAAIINITGNVMDNTGDGIWVANWLEPSYATVLDTLSITGNEIYDGAKKGIKVVGTATGTIAIQSNIITGKAEEGIFVASPDVDVSVEGNTITNNGGGATGIHVGKALGTWLIDDNDISENEGPGIYIGSTTDGETVGDVNITNNRICRNDLGIYLYEDACGVEVLDNCIVNNGHGVYIAGDDNVIGAEGHGNVISMNRAIDSGVHLTRTAFGNLINYNDITLNTGNPDGDYGVNNENFVPVDATNNWWGDASGPYHPTTNPTGTGDAVSDYVQFVPFLTAPAVDTTDPTITYSAASPSMVSLWHDGMFSDMWEGWNTYSVGPSCYTMFSVKASDDTCGGPAKVTINKKDLLLSMIPPEKLDKFIDRLDPKGLEAWEEFLAHLENIEMEYNEGYGCWVEGECLCGILYIALEEEVLNVNDIELAEILGQELKLGEFEIEVTAYDFSGNTDTALITITIVDYQMPICEGWNLRSTWLALENNKWQDIVATDDGLDTDSILRWNSELQRWEGYQEAAGVGYWYYGGTQVAPALMKTLESYWIHGLYNDQFGLITFRGVSAPPARQMYAGWSLIGAALAWQQPSLRVNDALISIYEGAEHCTGYTHVLSIDQYNDWNEQFYICGTHEWDRHYYKWFYQETWVFTRGFWGEPPMTRGGGYWVFMANPAVLAGFNSTPLPASFWSYWWD